LRGGSFAASFGRERCVRVDCRAPLPRHRRSRSPPSRPRLPRHTSRTRPETRAALEPERWKWHPVNMSRSGDQSEVDLNAQQRRLIRAPLKMLWSCLVAILRWLRNPTHLVGIISILVLAVLTLVPTAGTASIISWPLFLYVVIGVMLAAVLIAVDRPDYRSLFDKHFGWIPVTVGTVTYPLWYWSASRLGVAPASQFFEVSAQVLPLILLAVVIDVGRSHYLKTDQLALPIFAVMLGEFAALNILAFGENGSAHHLHATAADFSIVAASLASTITALILAVLANLEKNDSKRDVPLDPMISPASSPGQVTGAPERAEN
jgi:hypothetical protein